MSLLDNISSLFQQKRQPIPKPVAPRGNMLADMGKVLLHNNAFTELGQGAQGISNYAKNFIAAPAKQAVQGFQTGNPVQGALNTLGTVGGVVAPGANMATGGISALLSSLRQRKPLQQALAEGIKGTQTPGSISEGLGIKNPVVGLGVDLATGINPKNAIADIKNLGTKLALKDISPNAFNIHPEDEKMLNNYLDRILHTKGNPLQGQELKDLQNLSDHYLGTKFKDATNQKIAKTFETILANKRGGIAGKPPMMGFVQTPKITNDLHDALAGASNPQDEAIIIKQFTDNALYDTKSLRAVRAAFNQEIEGLVGNQGGYKKNFAIRQVLKGSPDNGPKINALEEGISRIDEALKGGFTPVSKILQDKTSSTAWMNEAKPNPQEQSAINEFDQMLKDKTPNTPSQQQVQSAEGNIAAGQVLGGKKGNPFDRVKGLPDDFKNSFQNWVNGRRATDIQGQIAKKPFTELDNQGLDAFFQFQSGDKSGMFGQVKQYFDTKYKQLQQSGLKLGYRQDYIPQLWQNSEKEVMQKLGRSLTTKPSFSLERIIQDYKDGIAAGLTPRFSKMSDLVGWYESYSNKALADRQFFNGLLQQGYILPSSQAEHGWVTINPDNFPKYLTQTGTGQYVGTYKAPPEVAQAINGYLTQPPSEIKGAAGALTKAKNITLSSGIPKTAINMHGVNILVRNTLASDNPVGAFAKGIAWMVNPGAAEKNLNANLGKAEFFVKHGLSLATEDSAYTKIKPPLQGNVFTKSRDKMMQIQASLFHDPLFKKYVPALKLNYADQIFQNLKKAYPEEQAAKLASKTANDFFGGINVDELGRSQTMQNLMRTILLAPDWAETNVRTGAGVVKGLAHPTDPQFKAYRTFARNFLMAYVGANILNKTLSGHWMFQNSSGSEFNIETGTSTPDGKQRSIPVFGTAVDAARIPMQIGTGIAKGDPSAIFTTIRNRLSTPLAAGMGLLTNSDYLGRKLYGPQMTPLQNVTSIGSQIAGAAGIAPPGQAAIDLATGRSNPEQAFTQAAQLPVRYSKPQSAKSAAYQKAYNQAMQSGKSDASAVIAGLGASKKAGGTTKARKTRKSTVGLSSLTRTGTKRKSTRAKISTAKLSSPKLASARPGGSQRALTRPGSSQRSLQPKQVKIADNLKITAPHNTVKKLTRSDIDKIKKVIANAKKRFNTTSTYV
jgi:hypothetical protein